jgi:hypothetical protein
MSDLSGVDLPHLREMRHRFLQTLENPSTSLENTSIVADAETQLDEDAAGRDVAAREVAAEGEDAAEDVFAKDELCFLCRFAENQEAKQWLACGHWMHEDCAASNLIFLKKRLG